jgi:hypothetical protein
MAREVPIDSPARTAAKLRHAEELRKWHRGEGRYADPNVPAPTLDPPDDTLLPSGGHWRRRIRPVEHEHLWAPGIGRAHEFFICTICGQERP